jgi:glucose-1-phosphate thymidylyltransferase
VDKKGFKIMKGILLAGGNGTRLFPTTKSISKQLLPVYDKPTIYYPLSTLMLAGIREIEIISTPRDLPLIRELLGDGASIGLKLSYQVQEKPNGIAEAFILSKDFIGDDSVCLILGDNIFYGQDLTQQTIECAKIQKGAAVFAYRVMDPEKFGVVEFDSQDKALNIVEKPQNPKSPWAVTGLYFYDSTVVERAMKLKPSARGELEITDLNRTYLEEGTLHVEKIGRGIAWLDTGSHESLISSSMFVQTIEQRQGLKVACLEEIAVHKNFITMDQLKELIKTYPNSSYTQYLKNFTLGKLG